MEALRSLLDGRCTGAGFHVPPLAQGRRRFVNRQAASGTRLLMDHLLQEAALAPETVAGYSTRTEETYVAVAAAVAAGEADIGLGIEAAARDFGLHFVPVAEEDYDLVCLAPALDSPAVQGLCATLSSSTA